MPKGERILGERRKELMETARAVYNAGGSIRDIAKSMERSYGFVHRLLEEGNTKFRNRGGDWRTKKYQESKANSLRQAGFNL
jgi:transposase